MGGKGKNRDKATIFGMIEKSRPIAPVKPAPPPVVRAVARPDHAGLRNAGRSGRKCVITYAIMDTIAEAIEQGAFGWVAARSAGIDVRTHGLWMKRGRDPEEKDPIFAEYVEAIEEAKAKARAKVEKRVAIEHPLQWLTRGPGRDEGIPEEPGWASEKAALELTGKGGGPLQHANLHAVIGKLDLSKLGDGDLDALEGIFRKTLPPPPGPDREFDRDRESETDGGEGEETP